MNIERIPVPFRSEHLSAAQEQEERLELRRAILATLALVLIGLAMSLVLPRAVAPGLPNEPPAAMPF